MLPNRQHVVKVTSRGADVGTESAISLIRSERGERRDQRGRAILDIDGHRTLPRRLERIDNPYRACP